ncbi:4Fe-4S ferredoxin [Candidatus Aerophobetes bacterium]|uniref:4Fe-4S ferredoxin n=1 Tax=Aerophobetes bacterium TaxID=2030807 RepID=A0A662DFM5_UNCAE|nr:MAG: 4Fe-4S ferredoxin [Candidatus Aerophobetes bacterium]
MKKISKKEMNKFIQSLMADYTILAPVNIEGIFFFKPVADFQGIDGEYKNSKKPPKEVFFPQTETMFKYKDGKVESTEKVKGKRILLGVRPCDARANLLLDNVFAGEDYEDIYYTNKRENTIIIGLACNEPSSTCFCSSFGGGPFSKEGLDILLIDIKDSYLVDTVTDKGGKILTGEFKEATDKEVKLAEKIKNEAEKKIKSRIRIEGIKEKLDAMFDDPFWDELSERCIGCGICSYLCPTCHCFDIQDEAKNSQGRRVRNWDSCMFPLFTLQASGHNPRPTGKERMRQRIMHKFNYFVENYKEVACVGCGRCIINCPVNIDIRKVLKKILTI